MKSNFDIDLLRKLIEIQSLSKDHKACRKLLSIIKDKLIKNNIPCKINIENGFPFLLAGNYCKGKYVILSHIDIVPGKPSQFKLQKKQDKLIGRGTLDMKGPLVAALSTFIDLWKSHFRDYIFVVTSDEEIGGFEGTAKLSKTLLNNIKGAIILDSVLGEKLVCIQKAPFHIKITHQGKSAHGSRPWEGVNSAHYILDCSLNIVEQLNKGSREDTTAVITQINSGNSVNVIPDSASSVIDIRIKSKKEIRQIVETINTLTSQRGCVWERIDEPLFVEVDPNCLFLEIWKSSFQSISGKKCDIAIESGASDARFIVNTNIPAIITSAEGGGTHSENEWVSLKSLVQLQKTLFDFCRQIIKI